MAEAAETQEQNIVEIPSGLTVRELAELLGVTPIAVIKEMMSNGVMASINQQIDYDTAAIVAAEMGFDPQPITIEEEVKEEAESGPAWRQFYDEEDPANLVDRPPVVAVLGHVDHGKTSLLDKIRSTNVTAGEAGGITQHIGAYQIEQAGRKITFLDTPGHEAFTAMRARGAQGADVAILVVAADDGVMPQTREALSHLRAANVPIVVALNKIDRDNANPDRVMQQLADLDLKPHEWDGDTLIIPVSAKTSKGLEDLLEAILMTADETEIKANPDGNTAGTVLEASMDKSRGVMATLLVQNGTLRTGDVVLAGTAYGRLKAMFDDRGEEIKEALPSVPTRVMGLNEIPAAGTLFEVVKSEKEARAILAEKAEALRGGTAEREAFTLEELYARFQAGEAKELNLIIKVDVQGSMEPVVSSLEKLSVAEKESELKVKILHAETGDVTESDVMLASASKAIIVGFQVGVDNAARRLADNEGIEIRLYDIIYKLIDDIEKALEGLLEPVYEDIVIGTAEVRQVFKIPKAGAIAGSFIREGEARRSAQVRVIRNHQVIHQGGVSSLKRFQEDVREVRTGFECGIGVEGFSDFQAGDIIQFTVRKRVN
ncbi:MAG: translation initiation factor IF-2 [Anaerolineae bacterium]|nr:translation initiation factor IF-2 [Anaerolineae bacterium]